MAAGVGILAAATEGFQVFTAEGARRYHVAQHPQALPDIELVDSRGQRFMLSSLRGQHVVVEFIYTGCQSLCVIMAGSFGELQSTLKQATRNDVRLLSISFASADGVAQLAHYAQRMKADEAVWTLARPSRHEDIQPLLQAFGIVVIPDGKGDFEHNAALHLLDAEGRLTYIGDYDKPAPIASRLGFASS